MSELPWVLTVREIEIFEAYAAEHGLSALLDHLGLDGLANEVTALHMLAADSPKEQKVNAGAASSEDTPPTKGTET